MSNNMPSLSGLKTENLSVDSNNFSQPTPMETETSLPQPQQTMESASAAPVLSNLQVVLSNPNVTNNPSLQVVLNNMNAANNPVSLHPTNQSSSIISSSPSLIAQNSILTQSSIFHSQTPVVHTPNQAATISTPTSSPLSQASVLVTSSPSSLQTTTQATFQTSTSSTLHSSTSQGKLPNEHLNQILTKPRLQELVREVDPTEQLDEEVEELMLQLADDFVDSAVNAACLLAKHRHASTIDVKDVQLHLERNWNMWIPGFGTDELRPYKRAPVTDAHRQRLALIRKTVKKY